MYPVSERYVEKIMSYSVTADWIGKLVTVDGLTFSLTSKNFVSSSSEITSQISTGDSIEIGTTCASSLSLDIYLDYVDGEYQLNGTTINRYDFFGGTIRLTFRLYMNDSTFEDVVCKTYTISDAERTADILSLTAYDNMLKFETALGATGTGTGYAFLQSACNACRVQLGISEEEFSAMPNGSLAVFIHPQAKSKIVTWQDLIGFIAQLVCGIAVIGFDDKLYIIPYKNEPVRTIPTTWRYSSTVADYDTYFSELTAYYVITKETEKVVAYPNDGLVYDLGTNPFLQFEVDTTRTNALQNILNDMFSSPYTPFTATCPLDPSLTVGDVIQLTGGQAVNTKTSIITKMTYSLNGSMSIECKGENPKTVKIETSLDKRFNALTSAEEEDAIHYYDFINTDEIEITDGQSKRVIIFRYGATKLSRIELMAEILFYLDTTEIITDSSYTENSGWVKVTYYINGGKMEGYYPLEEYMDGEHILPLIYEFSTSPIAIGTFEVWITMRGASITIGKNQARAFISGTGLVGDDVWDGNVYVYDSVNRFNPLHKFFRGATDSVEGSVHIPIGESVRDSLGRLSTQKIFRGFTDAKEATSDIMSFTPTVNYQYVFTNCQVVDNRWIGEGSIREGTAKYWICEPVYGIDHVTAKQLSVVFYASADDGETWYGYTTDGWIQDSEMIYATISSITAEEWEELGHAIRIKAYVEDEGYLASLNLYGGDIYEEE